MTKPEKLYTCFNVSCNTKSLACELMHHSQLVRGSHDQAELCSSVADGHGSFWRSGQPFCDPGWIKSLEKKFV